MIHNGRRDALFCLAVVIGWLVVLLIYLMH